MAKFEDVKNDLIDYLAKVDKEKLNMLDLKAYAEIIQIVDEMNQKNYYGNLLEKMSTGFTMPAYHPVETKEV